MRGYLVKLEEEVFFFDEEDALIYEHIKNNSYSGIFLFSNLLKNKKGVQWNKQRVENLIEMGLVGYLDGDYECVHIVGVDGFGGGEEWDEVFIDCLTKEDILDDALETFIPYEECPVCREKIKESTLNKIRRICPDFNERKAS